MEDKRLRHRFGPGCQASPRAELPSC